MRGQNTRHTGLLRQPEALGRLLLGMLPEEAKELLHVIATHSASMGQCHSELV